jgi:hypothetical protein
MDKNGNLIYEKQNGQEVKPPTQLELVPLSPEEEKNLPW